MKKLLFLTLLLCTIVLPFNVAAVESNGTINNVNWNYQDGVLTLTTENDSLGYVIPSAEYTQGIWYNYKDEIKKIVVGDGIDIISRYAFQNYSNLEEVELPKSRGGYIGDYAFYNCNKLKNIVLPIGMSRIGDYAFYGTGITEIELPIYIDWTYDHTFNENTTITRPAEYDEIIAAGTSGKAKQMPEPMGNGNPNNNTCYNKFYYSEFYDDTSYWKLYKRFVPH